MSSSIPPRLYDMSPTESKKQEDVSETELVYPVELADATIQPSKSDDDLFDSNDFSKTYLAKSRILSNAMNEIGFGRYQWYLFFVAGFGWMSDNIWPVCTSLILMRLDEVDGPHPPAEGRAPYLTLSQNLGLLVGAMVWSLSADTIGRRWAFNLTFLFTGVFAVIAGASPNFASICVFDALWSFGVGGNLPVDSAIFLEALPSSHQWLLTVMSFWWAIGQVIANLVSWGLISNFSCPDDESVCHRADNKGWRYFLFTMGGMTLLMFAARFLVSVYESPKFYLAKGDDYKAVETIHKIARINGKTCTLTVEELYAIDRQEQEESDLDDSKSSDTKSVTQGTTNLIVEKLRKYNFEHIRQCFGSRKLAISSILVILSWAVIGLAFPLYNAFLPYYLETRGNANEPLSVAKTYRNSLIVSAIGVPGSLIAGVLVEFRIGRKGTLCLSLILTGVFLFASTTAKTSNAYLGWNCTFSFFSDIMYGVLYAYTPEVFPSKVRGTAVGLAASANRILGIFSPVIAMRANLTTSAPIFVSGALFIFAGILVVFFPYEPRGKSSF